jgi:hypothetical protein
MEGVGVPVLDRIVERPELARELGRRDRLAAFSQLLFAAGPILCAARSLRRRGAVPIQT